MLKTRIHGRFRSGMMKEAARRSDSVVDLVVCGVKGVVSVDGVRGASLIGIRRTMGELVAFTTQCAAKPVNTPPVQALMRHTTPVKIANVTLWCCARLRQPSMLEDRRGMRLWSLRSVF